uniref:Eukaryotic translation initiation factor 4E binding protein 1 n=2 Tax=Sus scrofa TaxID=9823 RepID=A0A8D1X2L2_PIG
MSSGSSCSQTPSRAIPTTRRVVLGDGVQLPPGDYSTTPGGTLFSTTPGGTRIIYDRKFLMECRNSPVTKTPPRDLPTIPGVTSPVGDEPPTDASQNHLRSSPDDKPAGAGGETLAITPPSMEQPRAQRMEVGMEHRVFIPTSFPHENGPGTQERPSSGNSLVGSLFETRGDHTATLLTFI